MMTRPRAAGFTLIELLIALSLVSLVALLLFSGLRMGARAWEGVETANARIGEPRLAAGFLIRALTQSRPLSLMVEAEHRPVFNGDREHLEFAAPLSDQVGMPGLYILRLTREPDGDRQNLVLTRWLIHPEVLEGADDIPAWQPLTADTDLNLDELPFDTDAAAGAFGRTLLLEDAVTFDLAYFGAPDGDAEADWHEEWLEQPAPPELLRIRLATAGQVWPDLVVALPRGTD